MSQRLSYASTGVDIDQTDAAKRAMAASMETADPRVLNRIGAFATLLDARFPGYAHPVPGPQERGAGIQAKVGFCPRSSSAGFATTWSTTSSTTSSSWVPSRFRSKTSSSAARWMEPSSTIL